MSITLLVLLVFILVVFLLGGGFILLYPLTRRLGALLEDRLRANQTAAINPAEFASMRQMLHSVQQELSELAERQAFAEALLEERRPELVEKPQASRNDPLPLASLPPADPS